MLFFKEQTKGNVVLMGRKTRDSLGGCLPNRTNIVMTHGFDLFDSSPSCRAAGDIAEGLEIASKVAGKRKKVFVIGGATMYQQFAPYVDRYLITNIEKSVPDADTFFLNEWLGDLDNWSYSVISEGKANTDGDEANFQIIEYVSKQSDEIAKRRELAISAIARRRSKRLDFVVSSEAHAFA